MTDTTTDTVLPENSNFPETPSGDCGAMPCSASWIKRNDEMPERGERVIAFSPVYPKGHEMRFRILDGQFIRITTEVEYWAYCEPMADSLPNDQVEPSRGSDNENN